SFTSVPLSLKEVHYNEIIAPLKEINICFYNGKCPLAENFQVPCDQIYNPDEECASDSDCLNGLKCCFDGCFKSCVNVN
ncbi:hypothetical protein Anas_08569, partial [Armadillidium nasatum]